MTRDNATRSYGRWPGTAAATLFSLTGGSTCSHRQASSRWFLHRHRQPWPRATMVTFWGTPAAACCFQRRGAYHPPQPFTTNAAFSDLWNMQLLPGGLKQASLLCAQCVLFPIRRFCDCRLCATSLGMPAVDLPLRHRTGLLFHPAAQHNNHTAMSTRLFPPRR